MTAFKYGLSELSYQLGCVYAPKPDVIFLVINSVCNLHCKMCDVGKRDKETQFYKNMDKNTNMSFGLIVRLVDEVAHYKPTFAIISTEPLLHPQLYDIINYMKVNRCKVQLTTNGWLLEEHAASIVKAGVDILYVSIDGSSKVHDEIRGRDGAHAKALSGIYAIRAEKKKNNSKCPQVFVNVTVSKDNYTTLSETIPSLMPCIPEDELIDFDFTEFVTHVTFSHLNFITQEMADSHNVQYGHICTATKSSATTKEISKIDCNVLWKQIQKIKGGLGEYVSFVPDLKTEDELFKYYNNPNEKINRHGECKVPWRAAQIFADGSLGISTRCYNLDLGNINEEPFLKLWNGEKMRKIRREIVDAHGAFPACYRCCGVF